MTKTILIVDDSTSLRMVVNLALKGAGFDVIEAKDGQDALNKLTGQAIAMIISDVNMPGMGGLEFVKKLKSMPAYKFTPVLMLTTETTDEKKAAGKAAGANAWMVKPFAPAQLVNAAQKLCA